LTSCSFILNFTLGGRIQMKISVSIDQVLLKKVQEAIEKNYSDSSYGVEELALDVGISRAQLYRRLHSLTGKPASQMIKEYRLEKSFELVQRQVATISEIAYQVGFSSPSYFNTCFSEYYGYPPGKVKQLPSSGIPTKYISRKSVFAVLAIGIMAALVFILYLMKSEKNSVTNESIRTQISIAVLPFTSLSEDPEKQYLADGVMVEILFNLSKIKVLRVIDRISVEQYRGTSKTSALICEELGVSYLLTGSFRKYNDLIHSGKESHVWTRQYDIECSDIYTVTSEVAQLLAKELQAVITPEEKKLIEKVPTINLTAREFYLRGMEELLKYEIHRNNREALEIAESFFNQALEYDPTFALAYTGLGHIYYSKHRSDRIYSDNALDSVLILANKALSFDDQLDGAYKLRGLYYQWGKSKYEQAIIEYDKAITFNPNAWTAYLNKGILYFYDDHVKALANLHKAASLHRGSSLPMLYRRISEAYGTAGFKEQSDYYFDQFFKMVPDSAAYYYHLYNWQHYTGNYEKAIEFLEKSYAIDSSNFEKAYFLGLNHMFFGQFEESLAYMKIYDRRSKARNMRDAHYEYRIGYAYWINGFKEEAAYYFETGLEMLNGMLEEGRHFYHDFLTYYFLASIYAFQGENAKAYENLRLLNQRQRMPQWQVSNIKDDPMFDSLRHEPEFQQIVRDIEAKYQAEHERVRKWLEENDML